MSRLGAAMLGVRQLYAYFRGAEYPLGRFRALYEALRMSRR